MASRSSSAHHVPQPGLVEGWRSLPPSMRILRAFLGVTFVYAGIQKLTDPNFLHAGSIDYIGTQLQDFARGSPIGWLLGIAEHVPVLTGVLVALLEVAVGAGTLLGVGAVACAATGLAVNVILFLSASWHVHPYFLGSDSIYAAAWAALLAHLVGTRRRATVSRADRRRMQRAGPADLRRRELLRGALLATVTVAVASISRAVAGPARVARALSAPPAPTTPAPASPSPEVSSPASPISGRAIATLDQIPVGGAIGFTDPNVGSAVLLRPAQDRVVAFSRVCPHAGCLVGYNQQARLLVCPCHGAEFDPARGAQPVTGPALSPLPSISVTVDSSSGRVVLQE